MQLFEAGGLIQRSLPQNIMNRVRLLLLILAAASTMTVMPMIFIGSRGGPPAQLLQFSLLLLVMWRWSTWYRNGRIHAPDLVLEALAITLFTAFLIDPVNSSAFVFAGLYYRPMFSSNRGTALAVLVYCAAFVTGVMLAVPVQEGIASGHVLVQIPAMAFTAAMVRVIASTLGQHAATAQRLQEAEHEYRTLVEQLPGVVISSDRDGLITYVSPRIVDVLGCHPDELVNDPAALATRLVHPDDRERLTAASRASKATGEPLSIEVRTIHPDGRLLWVRYEEHLVADSTGHNRFWRGLITDITERHALSEQLQHQAFHDSLTGLPNRSLFEERLEHALRRQTRRPALHAVIFLDLDNFKIVNDSLGHKMGDQFLINAANRISAGVRAGDTVARFGGDEFAVLIEDLDDESEALHVARRLVAQLSAPYHLGGYAMHSSASIGIAFSRERGYRADELVRHADVAMYESKRGGKGRYTIFEPEMDARAWERMELEAELRQAIEQQQFDIHYQPVVDLATGQITELEALVRWQHPTRGMLAPGFFIPLAEETGLVADIDRWVLSSASRQVARWQQQYPEFARLTLSTNVSPNWLSDDSLVTDVAHILRTSGLRPDHLKLEVTEHALVDDVERATATLEALHTLGVRIAIDDFGTGNSAFSYFRSLPIDTLKIDRSYVRELDNTDKGTTLIHALITLAKSLGLLVTAEGLETHDHLRLGAMGCDLGQGFFFSRPVAAEAISALLAEKRVYVVKPAAALDDTVTIIPMERRRAGLPRDVDDAETGAAAKTAATSA